MKAVFVKHGFTDKYLGPAENFINYVNKNMEKSELVILNYPLLRLQRGEVNELRFRNGDLYFDQTKNRFLKPPMSYLLDLIPKKREESFQIGFAFNPLAFLIMLISFKSEKKIYWSVDFTKQRFRNQLLNYVYVKIERFASRRADLVIDNNSHARVERHLSFKNDSTKSIVIPIGFDIQLCDFDEKNPRTSKCFKIAFFGALNERNGAETIRGIIDILIKSSKKFEFHLMGEGANLYSMRKIYADVPQVFLHGYIPSLTEVSRILRDSDLGIAPFSKMQNSFTEFADPGKLVAYLSAGLPFLVTDVPKVAKLYEQQGFAQVIPVEATPSDWCREIITLEENGAKIHEMRIAAREQQLSRDHRVLFDGLIAKLIQEKIYEPQ